MGAFAFLLLGYALTGSTALAGGMAFASSVALYVAGLAVVALLLPAVNAGLMSYEVLVTPDARQGRVTTAVTFLAMGLAPLAPVLSGVLLERWPATPTLLVFGGLLLVAAGLGASSRALRGIPRLADLVPVA